MTTTAVTVDILSLKVGVEVASLAPSIHNTQPWRFSIGANYVDVFADRSRWLPATDESGRELHLSCGAAIEYLRAGLALQGLTSTTTLQPDEHNADHLAHVEVDGFQEPSPTERRLAEAIFLRYTDRGRYLDRRIPDQLVSDLIDGANTFSVLLRPIVTRSAQTIAAHLLAKADDIINSDQHYVDELMRWTRTDNAAEDGITARTIATRPLAERGSMFRLRDFSVGAPPPEPEQIYVVLFVTPEDGVRNWLDAGQALAWVLARAAQDGVTAQPLSQIIEVSSMRHQLAHQLNLEGHPQMMLRLGYGKGGPKAHRRRYEDLVRQARTDQIDDK